MTTSLVFMEDDDALPTDMFYNTGIATYVWILSNKKEPKRKGKVQLINGVHLYQKMRKSLGSKRNEIGDEDVKLITQAFGRFKAIESYRLDKEADEKSNRGRQSASKKKADKKTFGSKIFTSHEFGYRRITIERPLRLSVQFSDERIETLRFESGKLNAAMQAVWERILNKPISLTSRKRRSKTCLISRHGWLRRSCSTKPGLYKPPSGPIGMTTSTPSMKRYHEPSKRLASSLMRSSESN